MNSTIINSKTSVTHDNYTFNGFNNSSDQLKFREAITQNMIYFKEVQAGLTPELLSKQEYGTEKYWDIIVFLNNSEMYISKQDHIFVTAEAERLAKKWKSLKVKSSKEINYDDLGYRSATKINNRKRKIAFLKEEYIPLIMSKYQK